MKIEKNWSLDPIETGDVLMSSLADKNFSPVEAWLFRGSSPPEKTDGLPKGLFFVRDKGLVFLTSDSKPPEPGAGRKIAAALAAELPFGRLLSKKVIKSDKKLKAGISEHLQKCLDDPKSFILPHVDIVQTESAKTGSFMRKNHYLIVTAERQKGQAETFCITPCDKDLAELVMVLRFKCEKEALTTKLLDEATGHLAKQRELVDSIVQKHGEAAKEHVKEMTDELMAYVRQKLQEAGTSYEQIDQELRRRLAHFKPVGTLAAYWK